MVDGWRREESAMDFPDESSLIIEGLKRALFITIMRTRFIQQSRYS